MLRALFVLLLSLVPTLALAGPDSVAVLYFGNTGNEELAPLKVGLSQMLITDLKMTKGLTVVERERIQEVLDELEMGHSGVVDKKTAAKVGKLTGAEWILMGGYFELAGTFRIDARLIDVETGEILHAYGVTGTASEFPSLEKAIAANMGAALATRINDGGGASAPPPIQVPQAGTTRGSALADQASQAAEGATELARHAGNAVKAAVAYSEGLIFLDNKDVARAREAFETAISSDPELDAAKMALASLEL